MTQQNSDLQANFDKSSKSQEELRSLLTEQKDSLQKTLTITEIQIKEVLEEKLSETMKNKS